MTQETKPSAITIDGNDYALDDLSANARSQIVNLRVTDQEIARLQTQLAIVYCRKNTNPRFRATKLSFFREISSAKTEEFFVLKPENLLQNLYANVH